MFKIHFLLSNPNISKFVSIAQKQNVKLKLDTNSLALGNKESNKPSLIKNML